ncbi:MAG: hypothetical protein AAF846_05365 [Chloroflexota bacterium]
MLLFRDEEKVNEWVNTTGEARGAILTLQHVWELSKLWYSNRMSPHYRGRTASEAQAIFTKLGLTDDFWQF